MAAQIVRRADHRNRLMHTFPPASMLEEFTVGGGGRGGRDLVPRCLVLSVRLLTSHVLASLRAPTVRRVSCFRSVSESVR